MTAAPDATVVQAYLTAQGASWSTDDVTAALAAEQAAQARVCKIPQTEDDTDPLNPVFTDDYPADLAEALCRRVAHNLANRNLPLGIQTQVAEFGGLSTRVGGTDAEVRRLEGPFRKVLFG